MEERERFRTRSRALHVQLHRNALLPSWK